MLLDGVDVRDLRLSELRDAVGLVFEDTFLFTDSVRSNIAFADEDARRRPDRRVRPRSPARDEFIDDLPEGYDTLLGEHGFSLSGGQRQRVAIARAILADPRVLILDDATSSVDPTKEHEIRDALAEVMRGRTTIIIAHRPATIALADRVVLIADGAVAAEGTHDELLAHVGRVPHGARPGRSRRRARTVATRSSRVMRWGMHVTDENLSAEERRQVFRRTWRLLASAAPPAVRSRRCSSWCRRRRRSPGPAIVRYGIDQGVVPKDSATC